MKSTSWTAISSHQVIGMSLSKVWIIENIPHWIWLFYCNWLAQNKTKWAGHVLIVFDDLTFLSCYFWKCHAWMLRIIWPLFPVTFLNLSFNFRARLLKFCNSHILYVKGTFHIWKSQQFFKSYIAFKYSVSSLTILVKHTPIYKNNIPK